MTPGHYNLTVIATGYQTQARYTIKISAPFYHTQKKFFQILSDKKVINSCLAPKVIPPENLSAKIVSHRQGRKIKRTQVIEWQANSSSRIVEYRVFYNNKWVATIPACDKLQYQRAYKRKGKKYHYKVMTVDALANESLPTKTSLNCFKQFNPHMAESK